MQPRPSQFADSPYDHGMRLTPPVRTGSQACTSRGLRVT